jgi:hypothetical protein
MNYRHWDKIKKFLLANKLSVIFFIGYNFILAYFIINSDISHPLINFFLGVILIIVFLMRNFYIQETKEPQLTKEELEKRKKILEKEEQARRKEFHDGIVSFFMFIFRLIFVVIVVVLMFYFITNFVFWGFVKGIIIGYVMLIILGSLLEILFGEH